MSRFYISKIAAAGSNVQYSSVTFKDGVNILHGPSNTGKSYVIGCINFMLGGEPPFMRSDTAGYDTIEIQFDSVDGYVVNAKRKIIDGSKTDKGAPTVEVTSNYPTVESGTYSLSNNAYSDMILKLMGIEEPQTIIATQEIKTQRLGVRTFLHLYFIDEDNIYEKIPAFDVPRHSKITASLSALQFLFNGDDLHQYVPELTPKERALREAKRDAVVVYIDDKLGFLKERKDEINKTLENIEDIDIDSKMAETLDELAQVENQIRTLTKKSKETVGEIYTADVELEESRYLQDRYKLLKTQYAADIKRLRFIIDGEKVSGEKQKPVKCPFCEHEIKRKSERGISYTEASTEEIEQVAAQLEDLKQADSELTKEIKQQENYLKELEEENQQILQKISSFLKPKAQQFKKLLQDYQTAVQLKKERAAIEALMQVLNTDALNQGQPEENSPRINLIEYVDADKWKKWSDTFATIVEECHYPNFVSARIAKNTYDAVVNKKHKASEGKGYRAFLNSIILFALMKTLEEEGTYRSGMLILDSPILTLKEKKKISKKELASPGMRESLFRYFVNNCGDNQIIIAENEIPANVDYSTANLIEFTQDKSVGTYGFLRSIDINEES